MLPETREDQSFTCTLFQFDLQSAHLPGMIIQLIEGLAESTPENAQTQELKTHCHRLLGSSRAEAKKGMH